MSTAMLEHRLTGLTGRTEAVMVGRAASGLSSLLSIWKEQGVRQKIALPSLLCQSPLAAVLHAGWEPVFCDIDADTGNVPLNEWMRVVELGVHAVLFVHLYGNVRDAEGVADICRSRSIHFIEDAAQAFGGSWQGRPCGSSGDAAIISFGHTKLIDAGHGGAVLTNDALLAREVRRCGEQLAGGMPDNTGLAAQFRESFYAARRKLVGDPAKGAEYFRGLIESYMPLVPVRWKPEVAEDILPRLETLDTLVNERREKYETYKNLLRGTPLVPLDMSPGSVPWRASFRLPGTSWAVQNAISESVRKEGVDISNWYIPSHWLMRNTGSAVKFECTELFSREIFQLWLDDRTGADQIEKAAAALSAAIGVAGHA